MQEGSLSRGSLFRGSLSRGRGVSVQRVLCPGGSLSMVSVGGDPHAVTCGRYASYWNAFLPCTKNMVIMLNVDANAKANIKCEHMISLLKHFHRWVAVWNTERT